jgi:hypothetical protein
MTYRGDTAWKAKERPVSIQEKEADGRTRRRSGASSTICSTEMLTIRPRPASSDMRYGTNSGRPTTVIPRASKPSNTKGKQTYVA